MVLRSIGDSLVLIRVWHEALFAPLRLSTFRRRRRHRHLLPQPFPTEGVPVFVMLPLDAAVPNSPGNALWKEALSRLARAGVHGIMVDVWWGLCERDQPGEYDFREYVDLVKVCANLGLKVQATCSFHACGGNVGDDVNIPLPQWLIDVADEHDLWYRDRSGRVNRECLSLAADNVRVLPTVVESGGVSQQEHDVPDVSSSLVNDGNIDAVASNILDESDGIQEQPVTNEGEPIHTEHVPPLAGAADHIGENYNVGAHTDNEDRSVSMSFVSTDDDETLRTPLLAYSHFIAAFLEAMSPELVGSTIVELQVGCGPCGELRYPSYPLAGGMWAFPGIGELQCFDRRMLASLASAAETAGHPEEWGTPPSDTGSYNDTPSASRFYSREHATLRGSFFLSWYADALLWHARDMLDMADNVIRNWSGLTLAVKISGIHWWKFTTSRAAEANAGYYVSKHYNSYTKIAELLSQYDAVLDFTCLEMRTIDQPFILARCGPRQLVREVFNAARRANVLVAGENALERYDRRAYSQICKAFRDVPDGKAYGFTYLRLGPLLLQDENFARFEKFVRDMKHV